MLEQFQRPYIKQYMTLTSNQYLRGPHPLEIMLNVNNQQGNGRWIMRGKIKTTHHHDMKWVCVTCPCQCTENSCSWPKFTQMHNSVVSYTKKYLSKIDFSRSPTSTLQPLRLTGEQLVKASLTSISQANQRRCSSWSFLRFKIGWN